MCSISGLIHFRPETFEPDKAETQARASLAASRHRGPDHSGLQMLDSAVIAHNRLSITDLSPLANQPMSDPSRRYHLVLNGEIFNQKELRKELEALGIQFFTHGDTEVLLQMLIRYGQNALERLNGFFAFAFFDSEKSEWLIARDRFGEKPLFWYQDDHRLCFASELRSLIEFDVPRELDHESLSIFLQFSYLPAPSTMLRGVCKLQPGQKIVVDTKAQRPLQVSAWYHAQQAPRIPADRRETADLFRQLLDAAVQRRLESDVPLGCFLSGGVDSSVIALLASKHVKDLRTFSIGFPDQSFLDETRYATEIAAHLRTRHEVFPLNAGDFASNIEQAWEAMDEPFADSSSLAVWALARYAKERISVALSGDGADEVLGGYNKHVALLRSLDESLVNEWLPNLAPLTEILPTGRTSAVSNKFRQLRRYSKGLEKNIKARYIYWSSFAEGSYHEDVLRDLNHAAKGARLNPFISDITRDDFNSILRADQKLVLEGDMLTKVDTMSMAHAVEVRPPFLDHTVIEFANALDSSYKVNRNERKILLRECFSEELPDSVFSRPKKGFEIPLEKLLRTTLKPFVDDYLSKEQIAERRIFKPTIVEHLLHDFYTLHRHTHTSLIYSLLVFQVWARRTLG